MAMLIVITTSLILLPRFARGSDGRVVGGAVSAGLSMGLPLGIPPAPNNQRMLAIAPKKAGVFVHWSAINESDSSSANRTEQLLRHPEVREFLNYVKLTFQRTVDANTKDDPVAMAASKAILQVIDTVTSHETAAYCRFDNAPFGGMICDLGQAAPNIKALIDGSARMVGDEISISESDGLTVYSIDKAPVPKVSLTVGKRYLIVGVGENEFEQIITRFKSNQIAKWLTDARAKVGAERIANLAYVNAENFDGFFDDKVQAPDELDVLGIDGLKSMVCITSMDDRATVIRTWFDTDQQTQQRLSRLTGVLSKDDVSDISLDSTVMAAFRLNISAIVNELLTSLDKIEPGAAEDIESELRRNMGFDLREDLVAALADHIQIYDSPREGGRLFTGWTGVISIDDEAKLRAIEARLVQMVKGADEAPFSVKTRKILGNVVSYLVFHDDAPGFTPAWCISEGRLIVAAYPQSIYGLLQRPPMPPAEKIVGAIQEQNASIFLQVREKRVAELVYPFIYLATAFMPQEVDEKLRDVIDLDPGMVPSLPAITDHLGESTISIGFSDGIEIVRHQSLPPIGLAGVASFAAFGEMFEDMFEPDWDDKVMPPEAVSDAASDAKDAAPNAMNDDREASALGEIVAFSNPDLPPITDQIQAVEYAKKLVSEGRMFLAIARLEVLAKKSNSEFVYSELGKLYYDDRQYDKSMATFNKCVEIAPKSYRGYLGRGKTNWIQDKNEESLVDLRKATDLNPESDESWLFLGLAYRSLNQSSESIDHLSKSISLNPEQWYALYSRGNSYFDTKSYQRAINDYDKSLKLRPRDNKSLYWRGHAHQELGQLEKAIADMSRFLEQSPLDERALDSRADMFKEADKNRFAIRDYNALIGLKPNNANALKGRGGVWMNLDRYDNAIKDYTRALDIDPDKWTYANRAICWEEKGDRENEIADYSRAIQLDAKYEFALKWRATAYMNSGQFAKSKTDYGAALQAGADDDATTLSNFSWLLAACPDPQVRDGKLALQHAMKASEMTQWKQAWIIDNVAAAHAELGDFSKAIEFAARAMEVSESESERKSIKGRLSLYKQNKPAIWE